MDDSNIKRKVEIIEYKDGGVLMIGDLELVSDLVFGILLELVKHKLKRVRKSQHKNLKKRGRKKG